MRQSGLASCHDGLVTGLHDSLAGTEILEANVSWQLYAEGNCAAEDEQKLAAELAPLLARYGASGSQMSAPTVNGPVHVPPPREAKTGK
jgi:hypothetical protein